MILNKKRTDHEGSRSEVVAEFKCRVTGRCSRSVPGVTYARAYATRMRQQHLHSTEGNNLNTLSNDRLIDRSASLQPGVLYIYVTC